MKREDQDIIDLSPEQIAIGELLLKEGFHKYDNVFKPFQSNPKENEEWVVHEVDVEKFSHMKRIHEIHYLAYSQEMKHFSVVVKFDKPKGEAGGGMRKWRSTMIPRVISDVNIAREFLAGMFGSSVLLEKVNADVSVEVMANYLLHEMYEMALVGDSEGGVKERIRLWQGVIARLGKKGYIKP